jgi:hypothetical protein
MEYLTRFSSGYPRNNAELWSLLARVMTQGKSLWEKFLSGWQQAEKGKGRGKGKEDVKRKKKGKILKILPMS